MYARKYGHKKDQPWLAKMRACVKALVTITLVLSIIIPSTIVIYSISFQHRISSSGKVEMSWLSTNGKNIVNSAGDFVLLRGANFMGYEFGTWNSHTEEDYARMASWGFNVVRLPIAWHYIEPEPGVYDLSYLEKYVDRDISWARKYGIYIVLDMHQWYWSPRFTFGSTRGNGFPEWAYLDYPDNEEGHLLAVSDFWLGKSPNGRPPSEINPSMQDRFLAVWRYVASKYANESTIAAYDVLNEPPVEHLLQTTSVSTVNDIVHRFYNRLISEIRQVDQKHIIIYETFGPFISVGNLTVQAKTINQSNIACSFHFYHFRSNYSGNKEWLREMFDRWWWNILRDLDIPIWVGEFGASPTTPTSSILWVQDLLGILKQENLGWAWWVYWKADTYSSALLYSNGTERDEWLQYLNLS